MKTDKIIYDLAKLSTLFKWDHQDYVNDSSRHFKHHVQESKQCLYSIADRNGSNFYNKFILKASPKSNSQSLFVLQNEI